MKMHKNAIRNICYNLPLRLQIKPLDYKLITIPKTALVDYPDEWFIILNGTTINIDKKSGFIYLNRIGFEANKEILKETAELAVREKLDNTNGVGWPAIESYAEHYYAKLVRENEKRLKTTLLKAQKLSETIKKLKPNRMETKSEQL